MMKLEFSSISTMFMGNYDSTDFPFLLLSKENANYLASLSFTKFDSMISELFWLLGVSDSTEYSSVTICWGFKWRGVMVLVLTDDLLDLEPKLILSAKE